MFIASLVVPDFWAGVAAAILAEIAIAVVIVVWVLARGSSSSSDT